MIFTKPTKFIEIRDWPEKMGKHIYWIKEGVTQFKTACVGVALKWWIWRMWTNDLTFI